VIGGSGVSVGVGVISVIVVLVMDVSMISVVGVVGPAVDCTGKILVIVVNMSEIYLPYHL
jgi:hypothetical protein